MRFNLRNVGNKRTISNFEKDLGQDVLEIITVFSFRLYGEGDLETGLYVLPNLYLS